MARFSNRQFLRLLGDIVK
ncbi:MAG TPA: hypothetical protein DIW51_17935 [Rhodospirillaceae bacterium]|nr:hypothetical protein [Magnetovibrio sp.]HCS71844.1 hypothetical protein [Rhodospirillaceae bacterium]